MMPKQKILWIDDEFADVLHGLIAYVDELESKKGGFEVVRIPHPDEALERLEQEAEDFACFIVDIVLPHGERITKGESQAGNLAGIILKRKILEMEKYRDVPVVVLTALPCGGQIVTQHGEADWYFKADVSAEALREIIQNKIKEGKNER